ncbi:CBS domain-containing protein [Novosphingobium sp. fls2-241-R2A-195]|jgi:Mg2+/Co2+ transporter CorC|uniref:CBS domain-containing protein n=1 Tax=Novosphingobium sp. fls2-241-R2A-195 TaxID=3040296 RepID=UPI00254B693C|nr:CBS domain-containing protein [Novosphingobium sp. fls2-241-R2A-195]
MRSRTEARHRSYPADATLADALSDASQPCGSPHDPLSRIADLMVATGIGRIPIVAPETQRVVGILTRHDLLQVRNVHHGLETKRART